MSAEQTQYPSLTRSSLKSRWQNLSSLVQQISMDRLLAEDAGRDSFDTIFDHFRHDFIGDPLNSDSDAGKTKRLALDGKEYHYRHRVRLAYAAAGILVAARTAGAELARDDPRRYLVATADIGQRKTTLWNVLKVDTAAPGAGEPTVFWLSEQALHGVVATAEEETGDWFYDAMRTKIIAEQTATEEQSKAHLVTSGKGATFTTEYGRSLTLESIDTLFEEVDEFWETMAPAVRTARQRQRAQQGVAFGAVTPDGYSSLPVSISIAKLA